MSGTDPAPHDAQDAEPLLETVPASQLVHDTFPSPEYNPASHVSQIRRPSVAPYLPAGHGLHEGDAVASAKVPAGHKTHGSPASELMPAGHASHEILLFFLDSRPGGQRAQA